MNKLLCTKSIKQKKVIMHMIYLLQLKGINFGYKFNWYIYGIFSKDLWHDMQ
jgi:hypothetical protein